MSIRAGKRMQVAESTRIEIGRGLSAEVVDVSPEVAKAFLAKGHPDQRAVSWERVDSFVNDLAAGNWQLTHQGAAVDADGYTIDGQHRFHAIVKADVTVPMLIVYNHGASFHAPIDRGRPRTVATLTNRTTRITAALGAIRSLEGGYHVSTPMTVAEADGLWERHGDAVASVIHSVPKSSKILGGTMAALAWSMPVDGARVIEFASKVTTGEMISRGDPAFSFRSWWDRQQKITTWDMSMAAFNCLRHHLIQRTMAQVYVTPTGYQAITTRRRAMKIPGTPSSEFVPTLSNMNVREEAASAESRNT
jgi:hypothetical protein